MAPHGIYPAAGDDNWVAIACRDDATGGRSGRSSVPTGRSTESRRATLRGRVEARTRSTGSLASWTALA